MSRNRTVEVLNDTDSILSRINNNIVQQDIALDPDPEIDWVPGDALHDQEYDVDFTGRDTRDKKARCKPCGVSWVGLEPCWMCGETRDRGSIPKFNVDQARIYMLASDAGGGGRDFSYLSESFNGVSETLEVVTEVFAEQASVVQETFSRMRETFTLSFNFDSLTFQEISMIYGEGTVSGRSPNWVVLDEWARALQEPDPEPEMVTVDGITFPRDFPTEVEHAPDPTAIRYAPGLGTRLPTEEERIRQNMLNASVINQQRRNYYARP